jgi:raffinose/stachyose/melibiose transport system permease protein
VLFLVFIAYPMLRNLQVSFYSWDGLSQEKRWIGLRNYEWVATNRGSRLALRNVLLFGVLTVPVQMALGLVFAVALRGGGRVRLLARTVLFLPVVLTPIAIGFLFADILEPNNGVLNRGLADLGLESLQHAWLAEPWTALAAVTAVNVWVWTGFSMVIYQSAIDSLPEEVIEAAALDGARPRQILRHILVPMLRPAHYALVVLGVIGTLKAFDLVYVLTRGGPDQATEMPTTLIFSTGFQAFKQGRAAALGVVVLVIALVVTVVQLRLQRRGEQS